MLYEVITWGEGMKRSDFFRKGAEGAVAAGLVSMAGRAAADPGEGAGRTTDNWIQVATGERGLPVRKKSVDCDVVV